MSVRHDQLVTLTTDIVAAYVGKHNIRPSELSQVIADVHAALVNLDKVPEAEAPAEKLKPPVSIKKSIQDDCLVCLEDGLKFKSLKRHLMTHHQLTPEQYREKWVLDEDYPMVAPAYAAQRSQLAKDAGLGQRRKKSDAS